MDGNRKMLVFFAMGFELVGLIVAMAWVGQWMDTRFETKGLCLAGMSMMGLVSWLVHLIRLLNKFEASSEAITSDSETPKSNL
jgi:hypothetical protein